MNRQLYLECYSGISGDMTVASLLDLGADEKTLLEAIHSLPLHGYEIKISRVMKAGIDACDFDVVLDAVHENHDHDMEYLHGHEHGGNAQAYHGEHGHGEEHSHEAEHNHEVNHGHGAEHNREVNHGHGAEYSHEENHSHGTEQTQGMELEHNAVHVHESEHSHTHAHSHEHRGMNEIREIIAAGQLTNRAKELAIRIFEVLAAAESKAHNVPVDEVHFHEVGAVDSIIDIVSVAVCLDNLDITEVVVPKLCEGCGTVRCQHGILPIPVPAVANIIQTHHLPVQIVDAEGEFITPTGAAIVAAVQTSGKLPKNFTIQKIGIGAGKREYERPGMLRAMLISSAE